MIRKARALVRGHHEGDQVVDFECIVRRFCLAKSEPSPARQTDIALAAQWPRW